MFKELKKRQEGFTIIEVMIVLVIAAVILLIVFLAVPALQRNSRTTQVKNEAAQLLSAVAEFTSNNNGTAPATGSGAVGGSTNDADKVASLTKNKSLTKLTIFSNSSVPTATTINGNTDTAYLILGAKCSGSNPATATGTGATSRQVALLYSAEVGSGGAATVACTESGL